LASSELFLLRGDHECDGFESKRSGKTTDLLRFGDCVAIFQTTKNPTRSPYLRSNFSVWNRDRCKLWGSARRGEPRPISFTNSKSFSRNSTKRPSGLKSRPKVPCFCRKLFPPLSLKTTNSAELSRLQARPLARNDCEEFTCVIRSLSQVH